MAGCNSKFSLSSSFCRCCCLVRDGKIHLTILSVSFFLYFFIFAKNTKYRRKIKAEKGKGVSKKSVKSQKTKRGKQKERV